MIPARTQTVCFSFTASADGRESRWPFRCKQLFLILYAGSFALAVLFAALAQVFARPVKPVALSPSFTQTKRPHRVFWLLAFLVPFLLSAFRWKVGTDYPMYISLYEAINSISTPEQLWQQVLEVEPLYVLMNVLIKLVFNNPLPIFSSRRCCCWVFCSVRWKITTAKFP